MELLNAREQEKENGSSRRWIWIQVIELVRKKANIVQRRNVTKVLSTLKCQDIAPDFSCSYAALSCAA
ncbi:MAG: hypothetical protein CSA32_04470 [Desulfobulbus propionicus]|nr:MAG: hypothetical protein CSA32_04470 [Desulfobulbus propionicus]